MSLHLASVTILRFSISSNSLVHLPFLSQSLAGICLPPDSMMRFTLSLASITSVFTNLENLSCHTFSYIPSVYESPRWGLVKSFQEILAEESLTQIDIQLCTAKSPPPAPPPPPPCQVLLITNSFLLMSVRLNLQRKYEALHSLRTRIFRLCKSLNPKMDLISPIHIINIMLQGHTCAGTDREISF